MKVITTPAQPIYADDYLYRNGRHFKILSDVIGEPNAFWVCECLYDDTYTATFKLTKSEMIGMILIEGGHG